MRSLRSRTKNKTNLKSRSQNYNEVTEIYISSELPVTTVLDEKPISFSELQSSSDDVGEKCGEVFKNKDAIFSYLCTICGTLLDGIEEFKSHVISHNNICKIDESLDELPMKIEQNLYDENLDTDQFSNENIFTKEITQEKNANNEKLKMVESETSTNSKIEETINKRKCEKSKQNVYFEILKSNETDEESDVTIRCNRENRDQTDSDEVVAVTFKNEHDKNKNVTDTTNKPNKNKICKKNEWNPVFCLLCNKMFMCQLYLDSHLKYDHIARNPFVISNVENQPDSWSDDDLDHQTKTQQTPNNHEKNEFIDELDKSIRDDPFRCRYCDKRFKSRNNRYAHECIHTGEKPFKCETCGKNFRRKNILVNHYITHSTERRYKCEICDVTYKHRKSLWHHIRKHKGEKPYKCKYCDRAFTQSGNRNTHERIHEKPFQCSDCGLCFGSNRELLIHSERKHGLLKPHVCSYCGKDYADISGKKQHEKIHEKGGLFVCKVCNAKFGTNKGLRIHIKTHPELNNECKDQNLTVVSSTIINDMENESNKSNEIVASSSTSLSPPNIIENVNENENHQTDNQNQNPNIVIEKDKLIISILEFADI